MNIYDTPFSIVQDCIKVLQKDTGVTARFDRIIIEGVDLDLDGALYLTVEDSEYLFICEIRYELRVHDINNLRNILRESKKNVLVCSRRISAAVKRLLMNLQISYIETSGNLYVKQGNLFLYIDGQKGVYKSEQISNRAFTKTGLRIVFNLMLYPDLAELPYSLLAERFGIGKSSVAYVMAGLAQLGYIKIVNGKVQRFSLKKDLLDEWMYAYEKKLKPDLLIGTFRFADNTKFSDWKTIDLSGGDLWGGEPGAAMLTKYLRPAILTIYSDQPYAEIIKNYRMLPDSNGNIKIYRKFWLHAENDSKTVPPALVYADLMTTGDSRCIETAGLVYEQYFAQ